MNELAGTDNQSVSIEGVRSRWVHTPPWLPYSGISIWSLSKALHLDHDCRKSLEKFAQKYVPIGVKGWGSPPNIVYIKLGILDGKIS